LNELRWYVKEAAVLSTFTFTLRSILGAWGEVFNLFLFASSGDGNRNEDWYRNVRIRAHFPLTA
jgi:hypothetical protein